VVAAESPGLRARMPLGRICQSGFRSRWITRPRRRRACPGGAVAA